MSADSNPDPVAKSRRKPWKTALLLIGSAAFGGLAIVLRNRKELAQMRSQARDQEQDRKDRRALEASSSDEEII